MSRRLLPALPVVAFGLMLLALVWPMVEGRDPQRLPSALIDRPAPDLDRPELALAALMPDRPVPVAADLRGRPRLINFFASWCGPCRIEHAELMRLAAAGVPIAGIATRDTPEAARRFLAELGMPYDRVGLDAAARVAIEFGVYGMPETFAIDAAGRIRHRHVGPLSAEDADRLAVLLAELAE